MACSIFLKGVRVLRSSNGVWETLQDALKEFIDIENIQLNDELTELIEYHMDMAKCGWGFDVAKVFTTSYNLGFFIYLLDCILPKLEQEQTFADWMQESLWKFYAEIVKYKEELVAQGK